MDTCFACPFARQQHGNLSSYLLFQFQGGGQCRVIGFHAYQRASQLAVAQPPPLLSCSTGQYI